MRSQNQMNHSGLFRNQLDWSEWWINLLSTLNSFVPENTYFWCSTSALRIIICLIMSWDLNLIDIYNLSSLIWLILSRNSFHFFLHSIAPPKHQWQYQQIKKLALIIADKEFHCMTTGFTPPSLEWIRIIDHWD